MFAINKKILILLFFFFLLTLFVFFENINFYYGNKKILDNNFFINIDGINNLIIFKNFSGDETSLNYLNGFGTTLNHYIFYNLFRKNIFIIFFFNIVVYSYIIYILLKHFKNENEKILILIFTILNFKIISLLNFPTKDINNFFSLLFLFMFYIEKRYFFLICSILLAFFSRNILLAVIFLILFINSNFLKKLNIYFKKKIILISFFLYFFFIILHFIYKYKFFFILEEIPILSIYLYFLKINIIDPKIWFSYMVHIFLFRGFLKLFIKEKVKEINFHICLISLMIIIISQAIVNYDYIYSHFEIYRKGNIGYESNFSVTNIIDEYCKKGFFFLLYPIKIFILIFYEVLTPNKFTINTLTQVSIFIFLIYIIFKKKFFINTQIFFLLFIPALIYSTSGHLSSRVVQYIYPSMLIYFLMNKRK
jgi:hypothetical protein